MMFGFGDDQNPYTESVDLLEDLVIEYITETVCFRRLEKRIIEIVKLAVHVYLRCRHASIS